MNNYSHIVLPSILRDLKELGLSESASTCADVIDWFADNGIFIEMKPYYTYALSSRLGFVAVINVVDKVKDEIQRYESADFASFSLCACSAFRDAMKYLPQHNEKNHREGDSSSI